MEPIHKIIVNPSSGQGRGTRFIPELQRLLSEYGINAELIVSRSEAHMRELFADLAVREPLLAAVGGDTTFTIMAQELWRIKLQTGKPVAEMAWIGVGSANDILRQIGLVKVRSAVAALRKGQTMEISLGEVADDSGHREIFLGSVALGAAPRVNQAVAVARAAGRKFSWTAEWKPGLTALYKAFRAGELPFDFELLPAAGRGLSGTAALILLLNIPHFSRGIVVNDFAALDSPLIDWTVLSCESLFALWCMQQRLLRRAGKVIHEDIQLGQAGAGKLTLISPQAYLVDGERRGPARELSFAAIPKALRLRVPCPD